MSQAAKIFVSHTQHDAAFCRQIVDALRQAGADVWYDEHNLGSGQLGPTIERELRARPLFVVILSPAALKSRWVEDETRRVYSLFRMDGGRTILPVLAEQIAEADIWIFLLDFKRVEGPNLTPYPPEVAVHHLLRAFSLSRPGEMSVAEPPPEESADDLVTRGKALHSQGKLAEALALFQQATVLVPSFFTAWFNLGCALEDLHRYPEALAAYEQALTLDPRNAVAWNNKGSALFRLNRPAEALAACEQSLALDPTYGPAWANKGNAMYSLRRPAEALAAFEQALVLAPKQAVVWRNKSAVLFSLNRTADALASLEQALALDPGNVPSWNQKGTALNGLKRYPEALAAFDQALALAPTFAHAWRGKALSLKMLGRSTEAAQAEASANALGG